MIKAVKRFTNYIKQIKDTTKEAMAFMPSSCVTDISKLYNGAHVKFSRRIPYAHHAIVTNIDVDNSTFTIIHFNKQEKHDSKHKSKITEKIMTFGKKEEVLLVNYTQIDELSIPNFKRLPKEASVGVAQFFRDEPDASEYDLISNNCEHFVFCCTTGYAISFQAMAPHVIAYWALKEVSDTLVAIIVKYMISPKSKFVEYCKGDCYVTITLQSGKKVQVDFTSQQNNL